MERRDSQSRRKIRKSGPRPRHIIFRNLRQHYGCAQGRRGADLKSLDSLTFAREFLMPAGVATKGVHSRLHSLRSASVGSTSDAFRAGIKAAVRVTANVIDPARMKLAGSR